MFNSVLLLIVNWVVYSLIETRLKRSYLHAIRYEGRLILRVNWRKGAGKKQYRYKKRGLHYT